GTYYAAMGILQLNPTAGQKALVYGATGAIGSAYTQFLKYHGVYVTAVCGGENSELVKSWGADRVIDYKTEDFTKDNEKYDFVIDAVGKSSFFKCRHLLKQQAVYAPSGGAENILLVFAGPLLGGKKVLFPRDSKKTLGFIKELIENGKFKPFIDRVYPLDKIADAFTYVASGQKIGNVIVTMGD
ncbi:MAG: NAD(P)-dependent alcohol dehydrogenase, partial [Bacteroidota bacterium]